MAIMSPIARERFNKAEKDYARYLVDLGDNLAHLVEEAVKAHNVNGGVHYSIFTQRNDRNETEILVFHTQGTPIKKMGGAWNTGKTRHRGIYHAEVALHRTEPRGITFVPHIENRTERTYPTVEMRGSSVEKISNSAMYPFIAPSFVANEDIQPHLDFLANALKGNPLVRKRFFFRRLAAA